MNDIIYSISDTIATKLGNIFKPIKVKKNQQCSVECSTIRSSPADLNNILSLLTTYLIKYKLIYFNSGLNIPMRVKEELLKYIHFKENQIKITSEYINNAGLSVEYHANTLISKIRRKYDNFPELLDLCLLILEEEQDTSFIRAHLAEESNSDSPNELIVNQIENELYSFKKNIENCHEYFREFL